MKKFENESNVIEYKKTLPEDNTKWLKTIVSFSNTAGGELIVGVDDSDLSVFGIKESRSIFEQKIVETIYNNIKPKPIIDIVFKNIKDEDIAIVKIAKGNEQPYYIKKQGPENGCYIRYGSTDQKPTRSQMKEMLYSKRNENFTSKIHERNGKLSKASESDIKDFLIDINGKVKTNREITIEKLFQWNLVINQFDENYVSNGLMLLLNNEFNNRYVSIGIFDGLTKSKPIKSVQIEGNILNQYKETMKFLLEELKTSYKIRTFREQEYLIPEDTLREIVANAIIHRNYIDEEPIRISKFDDRIEIFSPGTLYDGLQLNDILNGISKLRNPNISEIFYHLGIIDKWGSGIIRANESLVRESMMPIIFEVNNIHGVNVIIKFGKEFTNIITGYELNERNYLLEKTIFSRSELENDLSLTKNQARYMIESWLEKGKVVKIGAGPSTKYEVIK